MAEKNIKLTLQYEGTEYAGWQVQPEQRTIQGELQAAIEKVCGQKISVMGAGRTDAGVHALGQVANFRIDHRLEPGTYQKALNFYLPADIRIIESQEVPAEFHARRSATWKRYRYLISAEKSALYYRLRWERQREISLEKLRAAASVIEGEHDFSRFCVVSSLKEDNRCFIHSARWWQVGPLLVFEIRGNRFLHNMVRVLVGAMANLAGTNPDNNKQNLTLEAFRDIIETPTEDRVGFTAPPQGLYLVSVNYNEGIAK
ncbi:MAG: tRNA pseudouridine(38-40) synthase TruA [candidate division Zixibacteria bacterium]|nr:tRNA pseudouridine(38-40) synthase TruA [candidate division Zixibacteria bacterium]